MAFNLKSIFPYLAGAGASGVAGQFSALKPFSAAIGAGAGALANKKNRAAGAAQGFVGGGVGSALAGGVGGMFGGSGGSALDRFGAGAMSGLKAYGGTIPGFAGIGTSNPTGAGARFLGGQGKPWSFSAGQAPSNVRTATPPILNRPSGPLSSFAATQSGTGGSTPTGGMNPMEMFKRMIPGAAVAGIGGLLAPKVEPSDYSGVKRDLMGRVEQGGNPVAREAALRTYLSTVNAPMGASAEAGLANARLINQRQKQEAIDQLQQQFRANNGSIMGNSAYDQALAKTNSIYDQNYAAQAAQLQFEYDNQQKQQQMAAANALAGMDESQLQYFAGLAGLDIMQIQERTGMDVASAEAIKQIGQTAGELMMRKSLGGAV